MSTVKEMNEMVTENSRAAPGNQGEHFVELAFKLK